TVTFTSSTIEDCLQQGIQVNWGSVWLFDNLIRDIQADGIRIEGGEVSIINNVVHATLGDGIDVSGTHTIDGNLVYDTAKRGIYAHAHNGAITLSNNTVYDTGGDGIRADGGLTVTVQGNTVYSARSDGIDARGGAITILRNSVSNCADDGIQANGNDAHIEANWVLNNGIGIIVHSSAGLVTGIPPVFSITNNMVADHVTASVELTGTGTGFVAHNTLVGNGLGNGLAVLGPLTVTVANNIVASHSVGITATAGAALSVSHTLLWANADDPISGTAVLPAPPRFVAPARQNYHLRADSPAIDAGIETRVFADVDGDPRPLDAFPDIGADEFRIYAVYLPLVMKAWPPPPPPLPSYYVYANPNDLDWLSQDPYRNETILATFCIPPYLPPASGGDKRGGCWSVDIRYRGDTARLMPKKSWKIFFPSSDPFQGQMGTAYELNLNADYVDQSLLRSSISYDLLARAGVPAPRASYARLYINGEYYGLFSQVEQVDERFLYRNGFEMHGNLYKPFYGPLGPEANDWWYTTRYPKKTNRQSGHQDLVTFIELINYTPDDQFADEIAAVMDVNGWLDWYAVNILIGNFEMTNKNYYIYDDFDAGRWMILPWDTDIALGHNEGSPYGLFDREISWDNPIDTGADPTGKYNYLIDRMMRVPEFRFYHCRLLTELMADEFSPAEMFPRIGATYAYIYDAATTDPNRWRPDLEGDPGFEDGPDELKTYITNRIQFLEGEMPDFCPGLQVPLTINEFMADNSSTITDEAGDADAWIEIHNDSPTLAWDVSGMYLTDVLSEATKWQFPTDVASGEAEAPSLTAIPPGGTLLIWADGEKDEGPLHANFALDASGGQIGLFDRDVFNNASISVLTYTAQFTGISYGRMPDGSDIWQSLVTPTPGWLNQGRSPIVSDTTHAPTWPAGGEAVTVTATITDEGTINATLWYRTFAPGALPPSYQSMPMTAVDGTIWQAILPAQTDSTWVEYYVEAEDVVGMVTVDRPGWPQGDYRYVVGWQRPPLYINELMAINSHTLKDEIGETDDWIELYNAGPVDIDMGGMYLSNNIDSATQFPIPANTIIPAGGYRILWADGDGTGGHLNFKLSGAGEYVGLFDSQAHYYAPIDAVYFPPQTADVSWGRFPEPSATDETPASGQGSGNEWHTMTVPTPGGSNRLSPPQFSRVTRAPTWPNAGESVTVTAIITAGTPIVSAIIQYDAGSGFQAISMTNVSSKTTWQAVLPPQPTGTLVQYYMEAVDNVGQTTRHPSSAPVATHRYLVDYVPPNIVINEFLADNASVNQDEAGEYDDWVELYNASAVTVTLDGMYLSDDLAAPSKWQFPAGTSIPPDGHLLVWCDGDLWQGLLHAGFKLGRGGEEIGLFDSAAHGLVPLDWVIFGPQQEDVSYGRQPDGSDSWGFLDPPTPGMSNE
ncbi:MAG: CotH kinase family protein, partial [Anaerolineae bacterium]